MKRFLVDTAKFGAIIAGQVIILFLLYLIFDPFKVLRIYDDYSYPYVIPNRDFISTEMFILNQPKYQYNSFIFGSSRTIAFRPDSWQKFLTKDNRIFMFDASSESIFGIYTKLKYLESKNIKIKNAFIVFCRDVTFGLTHDHMGHLFIKHPEVSGSGDIHFQKTFLKAYFDPKFLINFYAYKIVGGYRPYMAGYIEKRTIRYNTVNNQINLVDQEAEIRNPEAYYSKRSNMFNRRIPDKMDTAQIKQQIQLTMLKEIKRILEKNQTNYRIVISPLYDQIQLNREDFKILKNLFGENVFDFSGKNAFTDSKFNYFESSHYRPMVGDSIFKIVYK